MPKPHLITFAKWTVAKWHVGQEGKALELKIRALYVDTPLQEYTIGAPIAVTHRLFVLRRRFRLNDPLSAETNSAPRRIWGRGGWLLVDRVTGRVPQIHLPEFDPFYSTPSWHRDYIAHCEGSDDGKKLFAVGAQLGRRNPILKKSLGETDGDGVPDSECPRASRREFRSSRNRIRS